MPSRFALSRATASAAAEMSVPVTCACGRSCASASAIAPDPVPRSTIFTGRSAGASVSASSTRVSVSGLGISTSGVTRSTSPQNSRTPVSCATGSPSRRRFASAKNAFADSGGSASVPCAASHARGTSRTWASSTCASTGTRPLTTIARRTETESVTAADSSPRTRVAAARSSGPSRHRRVRICAARSVTRCCRDP